MIADLLSLIIGAMLGFYGQTVYGLLKKLYDEQIERHEAKQVGVVRPERILATKDQPISLESETGGVMRPRPAVLEDERQDNRAKILRENHQ